MKQHNQAIDAIFVAVGKAYDLTKSQILAKSNGTTAAELIESRALCMYFLRKIGLTFQQVASVMQRTAASSAQKAYTQVEMWVEKDLYKDFTYKFYHLSDVFKMPQLPENTPTNEQNEVFENFDSDATSNENVQLTNEPTHTFSPIQEQTPIQEQIQEEGLDDLIANIEDDTPDPLSVTDAPLAQTPITRDLGSHYKPSAEAEAISKGADYDNPFADLDNVVTTKTPKTPIIDDSVAAAEFEKMPTNTGGSTGGNTSKVIIDNDTADFTTETFVNVLVVASTEICHHYSKIDEEAVRKLEKEGEVPKQSTKTAIDINKNAHKTLENTAQTRSELIKEALKKVIINKNVSVSPETALILMFLMFVGFMFMTTKQLKQDGIDAIERMRDVKIDNDKNKATS